MSSTKTILLLSILLRLSVGGQTVALPELPSVSFHESFSAPNKTGAIQSGTFAHLSPESGIDQETSSSIIKPLISFSTYFGGRRRDDDFAIASDSNGFVYVAGETASGNLPVLNGFQPKYAGGTDAFLAKIDPRTSKIIFCTYIGGRDIDGISRIRVDGANNIYITGGTLSQDFPVKNPLQKKLKGSVDVFLAKFDGKGQLLFSTFIGGRGNENASALSLDKKGQPWITGFTDSRDFPLVPCNS